MKPVSVLQNNLMSGIPYMHIAKRSSPRPKAHPTWSLIPPEIKKSNSVWLLNLQFKTVVRKIQNNNASSFYFFGGLTICKNFLSNYSTAQQLHPIVFVSDFQLKWRMSKWENWFNPASFGFWKYNVLKDYRRRRGKMAYLLVSHLAKLAGGHFYQR